MKRQTKAQRERQQKAALRQRIRDIATGAAGCSLDDEAGWEVWNLGPEVFDRYLVALNVLFGVGEDNPNCEGDAWKELALMPCHYERLSGIDSAVEHLWSRGARA